MTSLSDAWEWYQCCRRQLWLAERLGTRHADGVRSLESVRLDVRARERLVSTPADTALALAPLDDLAVLVLFSVFEAIVRAGLLDQIADEVTESSHPVVRKAVDEAKLGIENGSFYNNVLTPYKLPGSVDPNLIEQVNQVRKYRNFVAHGRRGKSPNGVTPRMAYERLSRYLFAVGLARNPTPNQSETGDPHA